MKWHIYGVRRVFVLMIKTLNILCSDSSSNDSYSTSRYPSKITTAVDKSGTISFRGRGRGRGRGRNQNFDATTGQAPGKQQGKKKVSIGLKRCEEAFQILSGFNCFVEEDSQRRTLFQNILVL